MGQLEDAHTPKVLVRLLRAMLAPEPVRRPPSAHALCERLRRCLTTVREGGLLGQLKTRRVYRVVLGYAVGAWVALQMGASALRLWGAPVWAPHLVLVGLVAGLGAAALGGWGGGPAGDWQDAAAQADGAAGGVRGGGAAAVPVGGGVFPPDPGKG